MTIKQVILNDDFNSKGVNVMKRNLKTSDTIKVGWYKNRQPYLTKF